MATLEQMIDEFKDFTALIPPGRCYRGQLKTVYADIEESSVAGFWNYAITEYGSHSVEYGSRPVAHAAVGLFLNATSSRFDPRLATWTAIPPHISLTRGCDTLDSIRITTTPKSPTHGHVYFIQGVATHLIKIGFSVSSSSRMMTHQTGSPDRLVLLGVIDGSITDERRLHRQFRKARVHGEWFRPDASLLAFISEETYLP